MRNPFVARVGGVLSADIAVPEHERELEFYSTILTAGDNPLWRDDLMNSLGTPVVGLGARTAEIDSLPLQWMPHFQVADVAASAANALELGGQEIMHGKDDKGQSQWAVLADHDGAAFGVIPVAPSDSVATTNRDRSGSISWLALMVPDAKASRDFYQRVVGWSVKSVDSREGNGEQFEMMIGDETAAAEICQFTDEEDGIPSVWLIHLTVDDLIDSLRKVREHGGEVIREFAEEDRAIIRDPVGVYLALQVG